MDNPFTQKHPKNTLLNKPSKSGRLSGIGHELLSIIFRFAQILLSTLDPDSLVRHSSSHRSVFQFCTKAKQFAFLATFTKRNTFHKGRCFFCQWATIGN